MKLLPIKSNNRFQRNLCTKLLYSCVTVWKYLKIDDVSVNSCPELIKSSSEEVLLM